MQLSEFTIEYSSDNEVVEEEVNGLDINPGSRAIVITSGGGRIFPYILKRPKIVYAVDINPAQQFLFLLKLEGIRQLEFREFQELIGVYEKNSYRGCVQKNKCWHWYLRIRNSLPHGARSYFDAHPEIVHRGPLYAGRMEMVMKRFAQLMHIFRSRKCGRLFAFSDLGEQRRFIHGEWDTWMWRFACKRVLFNPRFLRILSRDKRFGSNSSSGESKGGQITYQRLMRVLKSELARNNHALSFLFLHHYASGTRPPLYLHPEGFDRLKKTLPETCILPCTTDIGELCHSLPEGSIDCISMSNVADHLTENAFSKKMMQSLKSLRHGGYVCWKSWLSNHKLPWEARAISRKRLELGRKISLSEIFYRAHVLQRM